MNQKKAATEWTVTKLLTFILAGVFLVIVIMGYSTGAGKPLIERVGGSMDKVLIMFGLQDRSIGTIEGCFTQPLQEVTAGEQLLQEINNDTQEWQRYQYATCNNGACYLNATGVSVNFYSDILNGDIPSCDGRGNYRVVNGRFQCELERNNGWKDAERAVFKETPEITRLHWEIYNAGLEYIEKTSGTGMREEYNNLLTKRFVLYGREEGGSETEHSYAIWTSGHWIVKEGTKTLYKGTNDEEALNTFDKTVRGKETNHDGVYYTLFNKPTGAEDYKETFFKLSFTSSAEPNKPLGAYTPYYYDLGLLYEGDQNAINEYVRQNIITRNTETEDQGIYSSFGTMLGNNDQIDTEEELQNLKEFFTAWKETNKQTIDEFDVEEKAVRQTATILGKTYDVHIAPCDEEGLVCDITNAPLIQFKEEGTNNWYALQFNPYHAKEDRTGLDLAEHSFILIYYGSTGIPKPIGEEQDYLLEGYEAYQYNSREINNPEQCTSEGYTGAIRLRLNAKDTTCDFQRKYWISKIYDYMYRRCG